SDDTRALQEEFARVDGSSSLRSAVLADYLSLEGGGHRLGEALSLWTVATREALRRRDGGALEGRLRSLETARARAEDRGRAGAFDLAARRVIDASLAKELTEPGPNEEETKTLLARLGPNAVDGLFDLLEIEPDRSVRTKLLALLRALPVPHHSRLAARLEDARWYVVRNAVNVLSRSNRSRVIPPTRPVRCCASSPPAVLAPDCLGRFEPRLARRSNEGRADRRDAQPAVVGSVGRCQAPPSIDVTVAPSLCSLRIW